MAHLLPRSRHIINDQSENQVSMKPVIEPMVRPNTL